jgi:hypothetical protein
MKTSTKTRRELYLSYVNDFLTVARFAEYYGMTCIEALALIEAERAKS